VDKGLAEGMLSRGDLDKAGREVGLDRVTKKGGHAFDESDESYARRLAAELHGAEAAGAMSQPASENGASPIVDDGYEPHYGFSEKKSHSDVVSDELTKLKSENMELKSEVASLGHKAQHLQDRNQELEDRIAAMSAQREQEAAEAAEAKEEPPHDEAAPQQEHAAEVTEADAVKTDEASSGDPAPLP
jgi:predicted RNase H-like nuclease (RuvC/YqgF family)